MALVSDDLPTIRATDECDLHRLAAGCFRTFVIARARVRQLLLNARDQIA
jgi:hypothetical protein